MSAVTLLNSLLTVNIFPLRLPVVRMGVNRERSHRQKGDPEPQAVEKQTEIRLFLLGPPIGLFSFGLSFQCPFLRLDWRNEPKPSHVT